MLSQVTFTRVGLCVLISSVLMACNATDNLRQATPIAENDESALVMPMILTDEPAQDFDASDSAVSAQSAAGFDLKPDKHPDQLNSEAVITSHDERQFPETQPDEVKSPDPVSTQNVDALCVEIGNKLGSVSVEDCLDRQLSDSGATSVNERPLVTRDYIKYPAGHESSRILIMGGIHGDEYSSISIMFKWMNLLEESLAEDIVDPFIWRFIPLANPDGLLDGQAVRQNANGVDLNRNFPSTDWAKLALKDWREKTGSNPRRFPGHAPASEPEVQWLLGQIREFAPTVIVAVHAPHQLVDFDGPAVAPKKIGELYLHQLGVYPGSLGNYAGVDMGIPVVTLELPSAGIMPPREQITEMWQDLLVWIRSHTAVLASQ
jgi:murein peptide amidase A